MSVIRRQPVRLTPAEADQICAILNNYARENWDHARRTKSLGIRDHCEEQATIARDLEAAIVKRSYREEPR